MKLLSFIQSLLPSLRKDDISEDLRVTLAEFDNTVIPAFRDASEYFKTAPFTSKQNKDISNLFYRTYELSKASAKSNLVEEIYSKLNQVKACSAFLASEVEKTFSSIVINDGMDAKKALLIRASNQLYFFNRFSLDLLSKLFNNEIADNGGSKEYGILPIIEKNFDQFLINFTYTLNTYGDEKDNFIKKFATVPDVIINDNNAESLRAVYHESKIDPVKTPIISKFENNPIYHVRLVIAEWQANRYKANKDKKKMLELKLLQLKLLRDKNSDPKLEQEIQYIENRIQKIEYTMAKQDGTA